MAGYCTHCGSTGIFHKTSLCPGIDDPKDYDKNKSMDSVFEMAKDLLMIDTQAVLDDLGQVHPKTDKERAFHTFTAALHAAKYFAGEFRKAHLEEGKAALRAGMNRQFQERMAEIESGSGENEHRQP